MLITGAAQFTCILIATRSNHPAFKFWWLAAFWVLATPLSVSWNQLVVSGRKAIRTRSWMTYRVIEIPFSSARRFALRARSASDLRLVRLLKRMVHPMAGCRWCRIVFFHCRRVAILVYSPRNCSGSLPRSSRSVETDAWDRTPNHCGECPLRAPLRCATNILNAVEKNIHEAPILIALAPFDLLLLYLSSAVTLGAVAFCYRARVVRRGAN
jgi:hypothetical protein